MKAVILAGGKGIRLRPYTTILPKPLVPIGDRPILDIVIRQLAYHGFTDIVLTVGHLAELIQAYFKSTEHTLPNVGLSYLKEDKPLGTAGPVALVPDLGTDPFLVMNGDILTTLNYTDMLKHHKEQNSALTIGVYEKRIKVDLGVISIDSSGQITDYIEKPEKIFPVSMGIYIYSPQILKYMQPGERFDFPQLVYRLLEHGERVMSYRSEDYWLDIGNQDDYMEAQNQFEQMKEQFLWLR
jgi:NDP-mannose synthase